MTHKTVKIGRDLMRLLVPLAVGGCLAGLFYLGAADSRRPASREDSFESDEVLRYDRPDAAALFRYQQRLNEDGTIPHNALLIAKAQRDAMIAARREGVADGGLAPEGWTWLGPGNVGGRIRSILLHPTQPEIMYVGSVSGGVWKTLDGGAAWFPLNDFMANLSVGCMAMDPTDPNVIYAGTGEGALAASGSEGTNNAAAIRGAGIFKSVDAGATWTQLSSTTSSSWYFVNRIAISPADHQILLAATNSGVYRSTDGGATWSRRLTVATTDVKFHPTDGNKAVAGKKSGVPSYSLNGGVSWSNATGMPSGGRQELAYAQSNPNVVYASVDVNLGEVWRSTDGGQTYALRNTGTNYMLSSIDVSQGWYDNAIWIDPTNPDTLVVGGIYHFRSFDGGATLTKISNGLTNVSSHVDQHAIVAHPSFDGAANKTVYFGNDGGLYRTSDVYTVAQSSGWTALNNNLGITQFYGGAGNGSNGVILGGTQDNGTWRYNGLTTEWTRTFGGDGGWCAADPTDARYFYGEIQWAAIWRSANGGVSATYIYSGLTDANDQNATNFISPFILDPNAPNRLLVGCERLWRTNDAKGTNRAWHIIKDATGTDNFISAVAVAEGDPDLIWVGHNNGDLYKTTNGTAAAPTWTKMDTGAPLPNRWCGRIAIDPADHDRVYVAFMGYASNNVWRSPDAGATWTQITGSGAAALPSAPVSSIVLHRSVPGWLYVGTDVGVFASRDDGANWSTSNDGPANVAVDELFWLGQHKLVAVTHGRGMYRVHVLPGDLNCDGVVDFFDIDSFTLALTDPAMYQTIYPACNLYNADVNDDGVVDFFDIDLFVCLIVGC